MAVALQGKVLIITGASSGIGAATAVRAARAGMRVVLAARRAEELENIALLVREAGGQALVVSTDVADRAQVQAMVDRATDHFGRVDALLANAGVGIFERLVDPADPEAEERMWRVNYFGAVECIRAAARAMVRQGDGGHILVSSSIVALSGLPYYASYAATKGALHALACSLAAELAEHRIGFSAIYPVGTQTGFSQAVQRTSGADVLRSNTPRAFVQSADHVARRIIACLRRPRPEVWPSRLGHLGAAVWTLFPRLRRLSFRGHARAARSQLGQEPQE